MNPRSGSPVVLLVIGRLVRAAVSAVVLAALAQVVVADDDASESELRRKISEQIELIESQQEQIRRQQAELDALRRPNPSEDGEPGSRVVPAENPLIKPRVVEAQSDAPKSDRALEIGAALSGLAVLGLILYYWVYLPYRNRKPLREAQAIIVSGHIEDLSRAEELLSQALVNGLARRDVAEARFALAYVRARRERYADAAAVLVDLIASGSTDPNVLYLDIWLHCRLAEYDKVERIRVQHGRQLVEILDARRIFGISLLHQARQRWSQGQIDSALHYFDELRNLGVFTDKIPSHIDQHQIILGVIALSNDHLEEARKQFQGAVQSAEADGRPAIPGKLGQLLCDWKSSPIPNIDDGLSAVLRELPGAQAILDSDSPSATVTVECSACRKTYQVKRELLGKRSTCKACKTSFVIKDQAAAAPHGSSHLENQADLPLNKDRLLLRNALLWHSVSLLFVWKRLPAKAGLPPVQARRMKERLARVRRVDPAMADSYLLDGLIDYFFARSDSESDAAVKLLEDAVKAEVHIPEVLNLVQRERKVSEFRRNSLRLFLDLLRRYLTDTGVPDSLRQRLHKHLTGFTAFNSLAEIDVQQGDDESAPSIEDLRLRGALIHRRIQSIVAPRLEQDGVDPGAKEKIHSLESNLATATQTLTENAQQIEQTELQLLLATGEFLFQDETTSAPAIPSEVLKLRQGTIKPAGVPHPPAPRPRKNRGKE